MEHSPNQACIILPGCTARELIEERAHASDEFRYVTDSPAELVAHLRHSFSQTDLCLVVAGLLEAEREAADVALQLAEDCFEGPGLAYVFTVFDRILFDCVTNTTATQLSALTATQVYSIEDVLALARPHLGNETFLLMRGSFRTVCVGATLYTSLTNYWDPTHSSGQHFKDFELVKVFAPGDLGQLEELLAGVGDEHCVELELFELKNENKLLKKELERFRNNYFSQIDDHCNMSSTDDPFLRSDAKPMEKLEKAAEAQVLKERLRELERTVSEQAEVIAGYNLCSAGLATTRLEEDNRVLKEELQKSFETISELRTARDKAIKELADRDKREEQFTEQTSEGLNFWKHRAETLQQQNEDLDQRNLKLEKAIYLYEHEEKVLKEQLGQAKRAVSLLEQKEAKDHEETAKLIEHNQQLKLKLAKIHTEVQTELEMKSQQGRELRVQCSELQGQLEASKKAFQAKQEYIRQLEQRASDSSTNDLATKEEVFRLKRELKHSQKTNDSLTDDLKRLSARSHELKHKLKQLKKESRRKENKDPKKTVWKKRQEEELGNLRDGLMQITDYLFSLPLVNFNPREDNLIESTLSALRLLNRYATAKSSS